MSLNFRPNRIDNGVWLADMKYAWHHIMVLLGWRQSISSVLRGVLVPSQESRQQWLKAKDRPVAVQAQGPPNYDWIVKRMGGDGKQRPVTTTACYLCFSNGLATTVIEKDRVSAAVRSDGNFIVVTNTDQSPPLDWPPTPADGKASCKETARYDQLTEVVEEAVERALCARSNWDGMRAAKRKEQRLPRNGSEKALLSVEDAIELVQRYPTTNECTHFACVMDPSEGRVVWSRRWKEPIGDN